MRVAELNQKALQSHLTTRDAAAADAPVEAERIG